MLVSLSLSPLESNGEKLYSNVGDPSTREQTQQGCTISNTAGAAAANGAELDAAKETTASRLECNLEKMPTWARRL